MGYDYDLLAARFFLPRQHQQAALALIKRQSRIYREESDEESQQASEKARIAGAETLPDALRGHSFGDWSHWDCDLDLDGNIIALDLAFKRLYSSEKMFHLIAPFVAPGSSLIMKGEEDHHGPGASMGMRWNIVKTFKLFP